MSDDAPATNRLNKHLALTLGVSRREADNLIDAGHVKINGTIATLGARFHDNDDIFLDNKLLGKDTQYEYIAFYKPINYVCSRLKQGDSPTI